MLQGNLLNQPCIADFVEILVGGFTMGPPRKSKMTGETVKGGLKWQCSSNCHLFELYLIFVNFMLLGYYVRLLRSIIILNIKCNKKAYRRLRNDPSYCERLSYI